MIPILRYNDIFSVLLNWVMEMTSEILIAQMINWRAISTFVMKLDSTGELSW